jgi:hypothetical protein
MRWDTQILPATQRIERVREREKFAIRTDRAAVGGDSKNNNNNLYFSSTDKINNKEYL